MRLPGARDRSLLRVQEAGVWGSQRRDRWPKTLPHRPAPVSSHLGARPPSRRAGTSGQCRSCVADLARIGPRCAGDGARSHRATRSCRHILHGAPRKAPQLHECAWLPSRLAVGSVAHPRSWPSARINRRLAMGSRRGPNMVSERGQDSARQHFGRREAPIWHAEAAPARLDIHRGINAGGVRPRAGLRVDQRACRRPTVLRRLAFAPNARRRLQSPCSRSNGRTVRPSAAATPPWLSDPPAIRVVSLAAPNRGRRALRAAACIDGFIFGPVRPSKRPSADDLGAADARHPADRRGPDHRFNDSGGGITADRSWPRGRFARTVAAPTAVQASGPAHDTAADPPPWAPLGGCWIDQRTPFQCSSSVVDRVLSSTSLQRLLEPDRPCDARRVARPGAAAARVRRRHAALRARRPRRRGPRVRRRARAVGQRSAAPRPKTDQDQAGATAAVPYARAGNGCVRGARARGVAADRRDPSRARVPADAPQRHAHRPAALRPVGRADHQDRPTSPVTRTSPVLTVTAEPQAREVRAHVAGSEPRPQSPIARR